MDAWVKSQKLVSRVKNELVNSYYKQWWQQNYVFHVRKTWCISSCAACWILLLTIYSALLKRTFTCSKSTIKALVFSRFSKNLCFPEVFKGYRTSLWCFFVTFDNISQISLVFVCWVWIGKCLLGSQTYEFVYKKAVYYKPWSLDEKPNKFIYKTRNFFA